MLDISGPYYSSCTGETVVLSGQLHLLSHSTVAEDGRQRSIVHTNTAGVLGYSASGTLYVNPRATTQTLNVLSGMPPLTYSLAYTERLVSQGSGGDLLVRIHAHATVNANGDLTVSLNEIEVGCV
jgi:hypothetical protein